MDYGFNFYLKSKQNISPYNNYIIFFFAKKSSTKAIRFGSKYINLKVKISIRWKIASALKQQQTIIPFKEATNNLPFPLNIYNIYK